MKHWLSIAAYTCEIAGVRSEGVDFRVRYLEFERDYQVEDFLKAEPPQEYQNGDGEVVRWTLARIYSIEEYSAPTHGDDLIGFISSVKDIHDDLA